MHPRNSAKTSIPIAAEHAQIAECLRPCHFYAAHGLDLLWQVPVDEEISWEIFRGRLLDPAHTRQTRRFRSWNIFQLEEGTCSSEPLLSVKLFEEKRTIYVVRAILSYVWEGYDSGGNVILSRETTRWVRELVGEIDLDRCTLDGDSTAEGHLCAELVDLLSRAIRGTSRLPLNSVEAPLPAFSLGRLAYFFRSCGEGSPDQPMRTWRALADCRITRDASWLESLLRTLQPDEIRAAAECVRERGDAVCIWLRRMFNNVSLSPCTHLVDNCVAFLQALVDRETLTPAQQFDFLAWLLRQLGRHLTAYDLFTFHHRGANYPDALLLDVVLKKYLELIESHPPLVMKRADSTKSRLRRRALRQGCLLRRYYENHAVPDSPTSPGENARVLPPPHIRVPEEQLTNVLRRKKRLYAGEPLPSLLRREAKDALRQSILDLAEPDEWLELGAALFIDRPFGWGKTVGEPDQTPLLAHLAFSPSIARRRFNELLRLAEDAGLALNAEEGKTAAILENTPVPGLRIAEVAEPDRPVASLADARRVAEDFVVVKTLGDIALPEVFNILRDHKPRVLARVPGDEGSVLALFDDDYRKRLVLKEDLSQGFIALKGVEFPAAGFRVVHFT